MQRDNSFSPSPTPGESPDKNKTIDRISPRIVEEPPKYTNFTESFVVEEVMRRLQQLLDQKPKQNRLQRFLSHPLMLLLVGAIFSGLIGSFLTYSYTVKQHELAAARSFSDELNKLRIQKLSEVWERLDEDEGRIDRLLNQPEDVQNSADKDQRAREIEKLITEDRRTVDKYRFWLGAENHDKIHGYLDASSVYAIRKLTGSDKDEGALLEQRKAAKSDLEAERKNSLRSNVTVGG